MTIWTPRRLGVAAVSALGVALALGVPTGLVPNPLTSVDPTTPRWSLPALLVVALLSGLLLSTYVSARADGSGEDRRRLGWSGAAGAYVAVCPTCTALVAVALGTGGAATWLQPAQPLVALGAIALLAEALRRRVRRERRCDLSAGPAPTARETSREQAKEQDGVTRR